MPGLRRRKRLPDGSFGPFEDVFGEPSPEEKVEMLEAENADLWYDSMLKDAKLKSAEQEIADLWYAVMMGGAN